MCCWKEAGCATELDYTEQTSWMLFLKYLDDLEYERSQEAELVGKRYSSYRAAAWSAWAAPKKDDGAFDHDSALTGADLIEFVNGELFPYLQGFRERASGPDTIEIQDRRDLQRDSQQVFQRLQPARRAGAGGCAEFPLAEGEARAFATSTRAKHPELWATPGGTGASTTRRGR